jgi:hypothetical protein
VHPEAITVIINAPAIVPGIDPSPPLRLPFPFDTFYWYFKNPPGFLIKKVFFGC